MLRIDIAFDLICPWCLIGKRQLDLALQEFVRRHSDTLVNIQWHAVQLLPLLPVDGVPFRAFYEQRLGSPAAVAARQAQVHAAAATVGLTINFDKIRTMPNTVRALALLAHAAQYAHAEGYATLLEQLFAAHFLHGENIGDVDTLTVIAKDLGFDPIEINTLLTDACAAHLPVVDGLGHAGVPHFVFNRRFELTGAQPASVLLAHMEAAIEAPSILYKAQP